MILPLCPACLSVIGGACGGPDAEYRPALPGEACGAADHDDLLRCALTCPCGECAADPASWECVEQGGPAVAGALYAMQALGIPRDAT